MEYDDDLQGGTPGSPAGTEPDPSSQQQQAPPGAGSGDDGIQPHQQADRERYIPRERFDEVNGQLRQTRQELQQLAERFSQVGNIFTGGQGGPGGDPQTQRLRSQLFQLVPGLEQLVEQRESLLRAAQVAPSTEQHMDAYWHARGQQTRNDLRTQLQAVYGEKPDDAVIQHTTTSYLGWLEADKARAARYVNGDPSLVGEFWQWYDGTVLAPVRRQNQVRQLQHGDRLNRLPSRGPASPPPAPVDRKKPGSADELWDQAFDRFAQETSGQ